MNANFQAPQFDPAQQGSNSEFAAKLMEILAAQKKQGGGMIPGFMDPLNTMGGASGGEAPDSGGGSISGSAIKGASVGAAFGPLGAAVGGLAGAGLGAWDKYGNKKG